MPRARSRSSSMASRASFAGPAHQLLALRVAPALRLALGQPQGQRERHQPLLRTVVEVALQAPALGVGRLDHARPRAAQLVHLGVQRGVEVRAQQQLGVLRVEARAPVDGAHAQEGGHQAHGHQQQRLGERVGREDPELVAAGTRPRRRAAR